MHSQVMIFITSASCFIALNLLRLCKHRLFQANQNDAGINIMSSHQGLQDDELVRLELKVMHTRSANQLKTASSVSEHSLGAVATTSVSYSIANEVDECPICVQVLHQENQDSQEEEGDKE